jgi:hypothetical protein
LSRWAQPARAKKTGAPVRFEITPVTREALNLAQTHGVVRSRLAVPEPRSGLPAFDHASISAPGQGLGHEHRSRLIDTGHTRSGAPRRPRFTSAPATSAPSNCCSAMPKSRARFSISASRSRMPSLSQKSSSSDAIAASVSEPHGNARNLSRSDLVQWRFSDAGKHRATLKHSNAASEKPAQQAI